MNGISVRERWDFILKMSELLNGIICVERKNSEKVSDFQMAIEPTIFQHRSDALITAQATGNSSDEQVICELTG